MDRHPRAAESGRREPTASVDEFRVDAETLWVVAILGFGIGDVVTTGVGLRLSGVVELHPVAAYFFGYTVVGSMVVLKGVVFGGCYVLWRLTPQPHCIGVPLGLAGLGVCVTGWNLGVLFGAGVV